MILKGKSLGCVSFKLVISYNTYLTDEHLTYFPNILISNLQSSSISKRFIWQDGDPVLNKIHSLLITNEISLTKKINNILVDLYNDLGYFLYHLIHLQK